MPHRIIPLGSNLLADFHSQALCLEDALRSGDEEAMAHALEAVTRSRGLDQLAAEAGVTRKAIAAVLDRASEGAPTDLAELVARLVTRWSVKVPPRTATVVSNRRKRGKTEASSSS